MSVDARSILLCTVLAICITGLDAARAYLYVYTIPLLHFHQTSPLQTLISKCNMIACTGARLASSILNLMLGHEETGASLSKPLAIQSQLGSMTRLMQTLHNAGQRKQPCQQTQQLALSAQDAL